MANREGLTIGYSDFTGRENLWSTEGWQEDLESILNGEPNNGEWYWSGDWLVGPYPNNTGYDAPPLTNSTVYRDTVDGDKALPVPLVEGKFVFPTDLHEPLIPVDEFMLAIDNIECYVPTINTSTSHQKYCTSTDGGHYLISYPALVLPDNLPILNVDVVGKSLLNSPNIYKAESWVDSSTVIKTSSSMSRGEMADLLEFAPNPDIRVRDVLKACILSELNCPNTDIEDSRIGISLIEEDIENEENYVKNSILSKNQGHLPYGLLQIVNSYVIFLGITSHENSSPVYKVKLSGFRGNIGVRGNWSTPAHPNYPECYLEKLNITLINVDVPLLELSLNYHWIKPGQRIDKEYSLIRIDNETEELVRTKGLKIQLDVHNALLGELIFDNCTFEDLDMTFNIGLGYPYLGQDYPWPYYDTVKKAAPHTFKKWHFDPFDPAQAQWWSNWFIDSGTGEYTLSTAEFTRYVFSMDLYGKEPVRDLEKYGIVPNNLEREDSDIVLSSERDGGVPLSTEIVGENIYSKLFSSVDGSVFNTLNGAVYSEYPKELNPERPFPVTGEPYHEII